MVKYIKEDRKLSVISDAIIFILLSFAAFLILSIFKEVFVIQSAQGDDFYASYDLEDPLELESVNYINKIKEEYSISVKYGASQKDVASRIGASVLLNSTLVNNNIKIIYEALNKYDKTMFKNFANEGYKISIVLLDKFENNNLALASRNKLNQFTLYISNAEKLERAFHHEMCHILEYYLSDKNIEFSNWNDLNPKDFNYLNDTRAIASSNVYYFSKYSSENANDVYFVTKYSKVNEKEDRAEIFAELMSASDKLNYIEDKTPIYYKYITLFNLFKINIPYAGFKNYYQVDF